MADMTKQSITGEALAHWKASRLAKRAGEKPVSFYDYYPCDWCWKSVDYSEDVLAFEGETVCLACYPPEIDGRRVRSPWGWLTDIGESLSDSIVDIEDDEQAGVALCQKKQE